MSATAGLQEALCMEGILTKPRKLLGLRVVSRMRGPILEYLRNRITQ